MNDRDRNLLRQTKLAARDQLPPAHRWEKSRCIHELLTAHPAVAAAEHIFLYVHFRSEVETLSLLEHFLAVGKTVSVSRTLRKEKRLLAVPITDPARQLQPGCYGILEPTSAQAAIEPDRLDLVLVPGSVFDQGGGRLGYGGGFYDRFLSQDAPQALRIGLSFEIQLVDQVPTEAHDQFMDILVTEEQLYDCRRIRYAQNCNIPR
ncbi:5-formyltetrahydrofolate cyclo-ligase [Candidatus Electronema sp. PJ]|uniref:5-formyltetrahydrofolate cyclo-ligase n=1 Tax=Candidatus Electronema sp. PJ TaxID=3401572 RepID=UPI003AA7D98E